MHKPLFLFLIFLSLGVSAQNLSAPVAEGVFGGQVGDFETWAFSADSIYVVSSTYSPNSLFWAKANRSGTRSNLEWQVFPSADADDGYGSSIFNVEIHESSNTVYFLSFDKVYRTDFSASSAILVDSMVKEFIIHGDTMALVKNNPMPSGNNVMDFGALNSSGVYSKSGSINLLKTYNEPPQMVLNPSTGRLHLFERGASPHMYQIMDAFYAMSSSSSLTSAVSPSPTTANIEWRTYGFDHAGTWYVAGQPPLNNPTIRDRRLAWSPDNGMSWNEVDINTPGPIGGVVGNNILITDNGSVESLFIGNAIERDLSAISAWQNPGISFIADLNRANDGYTKQDALDGNIVYHSTNIGFGYSVDIGDSIFGWNEGLTAVQVNDIDMTSDFATGWVASKSGVRKVENYNTASPNWSGPAFPTFDGAPYTAVGMTPGKADTVFVGNQRIYRTLNGGQQIGPMNDGWSQVFTPEDPPLNYNRINTHCTGIAVSPDSAEVIIAGFSIDFADQGGCFYSTDGGTNWQQLLLVASSPGQDVDVSDVVFTAESGKIVAYIGLESDPISSGQYGLFRAELGSTGFTVSREGSFGAQEGVVDLEVNNSGDSLYVLIRHNILLPNNSVHIKDLSTGTWSSVIGVSATGAPTAITDGDGYLFVSMDERIYMNSTDGSLGWSLGYAYPVGTEINVLFYDELLVGTGTGLYAHDIVNNISAEESQAIPRMAVYPNPAQNSVHWERLSEVKVYTVSGQMVYQSTKPENSFNCSDLNAGLYILKFDNGAQAKALIQH